MQKTRIATFSIAVPAMLGIMGLAHAADAQGSDTEDLAKQSQNPVSSLISVPFELNINSNAGPDNATDYVLNVKPVYPTGISKNWNLINRLIVPLVSQGDRGADLGRESGLGDFTYQAFLSPSKPGKLIWGAGPQLGIPTGMDRATSDQWTLGPSVVVLTMPGHWVLGALVSNSWNVGHGYDDAPNVDFFSAQYFVNYNMKKGWYLTSTPTLTANWKAESGEKWTVPFGGGFGRVFKIGKQSVNAKLAGYYNVEKPEDASNWTLQAALILLFPK